MSEPTYNNDVVYIYSRDRVDNVRKLVPLWHKELFHVRVVTEPGQGDAYLETGADSVKEVPEANLGIGYKQNFCVQEASNLDLDSIILTDDDIKPVRGMLKLLDLATHPKVVGITARYDYHSLAMGNDITKCSGLVLQPAGIFRIVALNIANTIKIGNYDIRLTTCDDADLALRALIEGYPWMVDVDSFSRSMGSRYAPGGMDAFYKANRMEPIRGPHPIFYEKYPDIVGHPKSKRPLTKWKKAYDKYMPNWREYSALHGGDISKYLDS